MPSTDERASVSSLHPIDWACRFLPHYFTHEPAEFHRQLLSDFLKPDLRLIARVAPRGHAKSTCAALAFPLWAICERIRRNIVIITYESSLALQFVRDLRLELESNERILAHYGDLARPPLPDPDSRKSKPARRPPKWTQALFSTSTGVTVQAKSAGASFRGTRVGPQRPDLIICDDIEKDDLVQNPHSRKKLEHWLRRVVLPALDPDGQLIILGSIIHYESLLARLRDRVRFRPWNYRVYRALEINSTPQGSHQPVALWPARWPVEKLQDERARIGSVAFEQEYQANPLDTSLRVFDPAWLRRYQPSELTGKSLRNIMTVDPATGASAGDFFALWVGSIDLDTGVIYTRILHLARIGIVEQVRRILDAWNLWRPERVGIETTAYQVVLKQILDDYSRRNHLHIPVVAINALANKRARIEASAPFYENGTMRLPQELDEEVELQFSQFPKGAHDDAPDVCAMGIELARALRGAFAIEGATRRNNSHARTGDWL